MCLPNLLQVTFLTILIKKWPVLECVNVVMQYYSRGSAIKKLGIKKTIMNIYIVVILIKCAIVYKLVSIKEINYHYIIVTWSPRLVSFPCDRQCQPVTKNPVCKTFCKSFAS